MLITIWNAGEYLIRVNMSKQPTLKEKVERYEQFLDNLALYADTGNTQFLQDLINNASDWSYAHRAGNGEYSDKKQDEIIASKFWKLLDLR